MLEPTHLVRPVEKTVRFRRAYRSWNRGVEAGFPAAPGD